MATKRRERAIELMKRVLDLRTELQAAEAELDEIIGDRRTRGNGHAAKPKTHASQRVSHPAPVRPTLPPPPAATPGRDLSAAMRRVLSSADRDFTIKQIMEGANVDESRKGTVYAALSRMVAKNMIAKGRNQGTYRAVRKEQA